MDVWLVADGPCENVERELRLAGLRHRRLPAEHAPRGLDLVPPDAVLLAYGAPAFVLDLLRRARAADRRSRAAAITGPLDARLLAELRPLADAVADRRRLDRARVLRLAGAERPHALARARDAARARAIAEALAATGSSAGDAVRVLSAPVQRVQRELAAWRGEMAFLD